MENEKLNASDVRKLHSESLQLRNQQFHIVTIALASTGISTWIVTGITKGVSAKVQETLNSGPILEEWLVLFATSSWLLLLGILFLWSLSLKRLIDIIGIYLMNNNLSNWETRFSKFNKDFNFYISQTKYSFYIFMVYGFIVSISGFIAMRQEEFYASGYQFAVIGLFLLYWGICRYKYKNVNREEDINKAWDKLLGKNGVT